MILDSINDITGFCHQILKHKLICINGISHPIVEVEFYLWTHDHPDSFSHKHPMQKEPGKWHFHRQGNSYRGGTYKGLDFTVTLAGSTECYSGILIRSIQLPNNKILEGPCKVVDYILERTGSLSIEDLVTKMHSINVSDDQNPFFLQHQLRSPENIQVYSSPRVGLTLKRFTEDKPLYLMRPYRYLSYLKLKKNKSLVILNMYKQGLLIKQISELTGSTASVIQRYISQFEDGRLRKRNIKEFTGDLSVGDLNYLYGYLSV